MYNLFLSNRVKPILIVVNGWPGAGKSTLSRRIKRLLRGAILSSDAIRSKYVLRRWVGNTFSNEANQFVFDLLYTTTKQYLCKGISVISDAMNDYPMGWYRYLEIARMLAILPVFIDIYADEAVIRKRVALRENSQYCNAKTPILEKLLARGPLLRPTDDVQVCQEALIVKWEQSLGKVQIKCPTTAHDSLSVKSFFQELFDNYI